MSAPPRRVLAAVLVVGGAGALWAAAAPGTPGAGPAAWTTAVARRGSFVHTVRLAGTTEAVRAVGVTAPRLSGQPASAPMVVTDIVPSGTRVAKGDLLVDIDAQAQEQAARDRRADFLGLDEQIRQKRAEQAAALAADETALVAAANDVARARLAVGTNDLLPRIDADKNTLQLEQAEARLAQLREANALKRQAAAADLRILEIQRDRADADARHAAGNVALMRITAPFGGIVVLKSVFLAGGMAEIQEGSEVRPGMPILDIIDPAAMRVRASVNQADIALVHDGQPARVQLDAYPDLAFDGRVEEVAPLAVAGALTPTVRTFMARISIAGADAKLMPDLSAAVDVEVARLDEALIVPRDAVVIEGGGSWVWVVEDGRAVRRDVTLAGASPMDAAIASGLSAGATVIRGAADVR
jgi:RND family efflux transporter MFP subunit